MNDFNYPLKAKQLLVAFAILLAHSVKAQNLTISTSGETGTSGTNWSISGNILTVSGGTASVNVSVITDYLTNVGDLQVSAINAGTSQNIIINSAITYTGSTTRSLTLRSRNDIQINQNISATNAALNVVLSTADAGDGEATIRANISTNGGQLAIGGQWPLGTQLWNGITIPSYYSIATTENKQGVDILGATITTNGGNVRMYGKSYVTATISGSSNYGIELDNCSLNSQTGTIELNGGIKGTYKFGFGIYITSTSGNLAINSSTGAISMTALGDDDSASDTGYRHAILIYARNNYNLEIKTISGAINIDGAANFSYATTQDKSGVQFQNDSTLSTLNIVSQSGNITIKGANTDDSDGQYNNAIRFSATDTANNIKIGYDGVNNYSGNIVIEGNSLLQKNENAGAGSIAVKTTGTITIQSKDNSFTNLRAGSVDLLKFDDDWNFGTTCSNFTLGKISNIKEITLNSILTINGPISIYGGILNISGSLTSSNTGDIIIKSNTSNSGSSPSIYVYADILKTGGQRSKLLMQGLGRVNFANNKRLEATNSILDAIFWSDFDNSNNDGGTTVYADIITNGGHVWIGGSNSNGGSNTWNGLTVGDGPSIGTAGSTNYNAIDLGSNITTSGGDVFIWAGNGYSNGINGIEIYFGNKTINASTGDITLITNDGVRSYTLSLKTTGKITIAPNAASFSSSPFIFNGTMTSGNFVGANNMNYITIQNFQSIGQLNLGYYTNNNGWIFSNTGNITMTASTSTNAPIYIKGTNIDINGATTASSNKLTLNASGTVSQTQPVSASELNLLGGGNFNLTNTSNSVSTISAGTSIARVGNINFINNSAFAIAFNGVYSSGTISLASQTGNITIANPINTTNTSSSALTIIAGKSKFAGDSTGGDVLISSSTNLVYGAAGTAKIYGGSEANTILSNVNFSNKRYFVDATTSVFSPILSTGTYLLYRESKNFWTGTISNSWNLAGNWSLNSIPTSNDNVLIPSNGANAPLLDVNFVLGSGKNLIISDTGTLTVAPNQSLTIIGNADFGGKLITFKSDATGTGMLGQISGTLIGASNVIVERYIPARRAFRFLSTSVTSTTTIRNNWQEAGSNTPGLGTHITGTGASSNGFDPTGTNNPSLFIFNPTNGQWQAVTNTNTNTLYAGSAYRLMVRGDRTVDLTTNTPTPTNTIIRTAGAMKIGDHTPTLNQNAEGYSFIGNPYQAPIDMKAVLNSSTNMNQGVAYYWDPTKNIRGAYVTRDLINNVNDITSNFNQYIQVGQAVMIKKANTTSAASITFNENHKSVQNATAGIFKNTAENNSLSFLRTKLLTTIENQTQEIEGALALFDANYSWGITDQDAKKLGNLDEQVSFKINNTALAIAYQSLPNANDEIPISLTQCRNTNYQWQFELNNYNGETPFLLDNQTGLYTQISNGTIIDFTVNLQDATSYTNRFKIVFSNQILSNLDFTNHIIVYPNPAKSNNANFIIQGIPNTAEVAVYNTLGQSIGVTTNLFQDGIQVIPATSLSTGIYLISITVEGKTNQVKWIVE